MKKERSYTLKKRARSQRATRERIVEALMALHEELGPKNTTISAIAERAGVQRLTVYRHFPDETELLQACTGRWLELNPPPDPAAWSGVEDGLERTRAALRALYEYFRGTQRMWTVSFRDEAEVPALQGPMRAFRDYLAAIADELGDALTRGKESAAGVAPTLGHVVQFQTWRSLADQGLNEKQAAELAVEWIRAVLPEARTNRSAPPPQLAAARIVLQDAAGNPLLEGTTTLELVRGAKASA